MSTKRELPPTRIHVCECGRIGTHRFYSSWECDLCQRIRKRVERWDFCKAMDNSGRARR